MSDATFLRVLRERNAALDVARLLVTVRWIMVHERQRLESDIVRLERRLREARRARCASNTPPEAPRS